MPDKTPPSTSPRQRRKEARPQELLDAALALFVEKGFAATRSEEVAARAGVSKGTLYLYYPSKEELLKAVIRQNLSRILADGEGIAERFEGPTSELLATLLRTWWDQVGETPAWGIHKIILAEVGNFPEIAEFYEREVIVPAHELISRTLQRGVTRGEFRPVNTDDATHVLIAPLIFLALHKHSFGNCPTGLNLAPGRLVEAQIDIVLRGLLAADDAPPLRPASSKD